MNRKGVRIKELGVRSEWEIGAKRRFRAAEKGEEEMGRLLRFARNDFHVIKLQLSQNKQQATTTSNKQQATGNKQPASVNND